MAIQETTYESDIAALTALIKILDPLDENDRPRIYATLGTYFNLSPTQTLALDEAVNVTDTDSGASDDLAEFIAQANTKTDIDITLIAAYWLQFRQNSPNGFKTIVISKALKSAGYKFSNLTRNLANLSEKKKKYLISSGRSRKEKTWTVSARGKKVVEEMIDGQD